MKATGIVRRIDDLGRIVIPKEIRRTMRIREGDPLEIYTSPDGEVIFKKYSPVGEISCTASQYADVLSKVGGCPAVICDRDHVIAVSGMAKKEVIERRVSGSLEDLIEQRKSHVYRSREDQRLNPIEGIDRYAIAAAPILSQGDVNGAVIMLSGDDNEFATNEQNKNTGGSAPSRETVEKLCAVYFRNSPPDCFGGKAQQRQRVACGGKLLFSPTPL